MLQAALRSSAAVEAGGTPATLGARSQVVLVCGDVGSGKTTVVLSLQKAFEGALAEAEGRSHLGGSAAGPTGRHQDLAQLAVSMAPNVVWLPLVDLGQYARCSTILSELFSRVEERTKVRPEYVASGTETQPSVLGSTFLRYLTRVTTQVRPGGPETLPIYVIPLDNFGLTPDGCFAVIDLVKVLASPNVLFVLIGDAEVAERLMALRIEAEVEHSQPHSLSAFPIESGSAIRIPEQDVSGLSSRLAASSIRKLIPPHQRFTLESLSVEEALVFHPVGEGTTLGELLDRIPLTLRTDRIWGREVKSFGDFLLIPNGVAGSSGKGVPPYSGCRVLRSSARHLTDLWYGLSRLAEAVKSEDKEYNRNLLLEYLAVEAKQAINEDPRLLGPEKAALREAIVRNFIGQWSIETDQLGPGSIVRGFQTYRSANLSIGTWLGRGWFFSARLGPSSTGTRSATQPAERSTGLLILLHDLLIPDALGQFGLIGTSMTPSARGLNWVRASWIPPGAQFEGVRSLPDVSWPTPAWDRYWCFDLLADLWNKVITSIKGIAPDSPHASAVLAYLWIDLITSVLKGEPIPRELSGASAPAPEQWQSLADSVASLPTNGVGAAVDDNRSWMIALGALLAPEAGVPKEVAEVFSGKLREKWIDEGTQLAILRMRHENLLPFAEQPWTTFLDVFLTNNHPINKFEGGKLKPKIESLLKEVEARKKPEAGKPRT